MKTLTPTERRTLRAKAHHLDPVVTIGQHGLTPAVLHELDLALTKHELVKIRVFSDAREAREATLAQIVEAMDCAPVQHLGKVLVVWRENPELRNKAVEPKPEAKARKRPGKLKGVKKTGPRTPLDPVRERRRVARTDPEAAPTGKGRRGAARHEVPQGGFEIPSGPPRDADTARRKSTYTPKTKPKSFSAKPNPRSAWAKSPPAGGPAKPPGTGTRRRRTPT
jgi:RNA-binding protein